jgi:hypothetical protein
MYLLLMLLQVKCIMKIVIQKDYIQITFFESGDFLFEEAFQWSSLWRVTKYKIEEINGIECIVSDGRDNVQYYDPLKVDRQKKRPKFPEQNENSPEIALARLDANNKEHIIDFVNKFGLLGLWHHPDYSGADYLPYLNSRGTLDGRSFSEWYTHPRKQGLYKWMEPVQVFKSAVQDYQEFLDKVVSVENGINQDDALEFDVISYWDRQLEEINPGHLRNGQEWILGWKYRSLISAIYLKNSLNKQAGMAIRRCRKKRCGKFFLSTHPERATCSDDCKSAYYKARTQNKRDKEELLIKYSSNEEIVSSKIDELIASGISGKKRLDKKIEEYLQEEMLD